MDPHVECWVTSSDRLSMADVKLYFVCTQPWNALPGHILSLAHMVFMPHPTVLSFPPPAAPARNSRAQQQLHTADPGAEPENSLNGYGSALAVSANIDKGQERMGRFREMASHSGY